MKYNKTRQNKTKQKIKQKIKYNFKTYFQILQVTL